MDDMQTMGRVCSCVNTGSIASDGNIIYTEPRRTGLLDRVMQVERQNDLAARRPVLNTGLVDDPVMPRLRRPG